MYTKLSPENVSRNLIYYVMDNCMFVVIQELWQIVAQRREYFKVFFKN